MSVVAIIPARMASSRFPGKPLVSICGLSMIEHVRRRVSFCDLLDDVIVATCDREIVAEIERHGGKAVMTSQRHESCVDRVAEVASTIDAELIINVQGDMPLVHPDSIKQLISPLLKEKDCMVTDMMGPIDDHQEVSSLHVVKVVVDKSGNALYYSRAPIPFCKEKSIEGSLLRYKQFGINAYRRSALFEFTRLSRTPLEKAESVDMLRLLENGIPVRMVSFSFANIGIDVPEDLKLAEKLMESDALFGKYSKGKYENIYRA